MGAFQLPLLDHRSHVGAQILLSFSKESSKGPHRHRLPPAETLNCLSEFRLRKSTPVNVLNEGCNLFRKIIVHVGRFQSFLNRIQGFSLSFQDFFYGIQGFPLSL